MRNKAHYIDDYVPQKSHAKSPTQEIISMLVKATNKHKLDYNQLKYIFRSVRFKCGLKAPRTQQRLVELPTHEELNRFYSAIKSPVHMLIFQTLEGTGVRVSELCNIKVANIDFEAQTIFIKDGKGGKDRLTVIAGRLRDSLQLYLHEKKHTYLFESQRYTKFSSRRLQQLCSKYKKAAKIEKPFSCHTFRHLWNSRLAERGIAREVREILAGHAKGSKSQDIYTHLSVGGFKSEILEALDSVYEREEGSSGG